MANKSDKNNAVNLSSQVRKVTNHLDGNTFIFKGKMSVSDFANAIKIDVNKVIKKINKEGINDKTILTEDEIGELSMNYGYDFKKVEEINEKNVFDKMSVTDNEEDLKSRAPIVTIMGHVDHGKTTLLDYIRKSRIQAKEAGGITQHIGAYQIKYNNFPITFLDTPGHAAFSSMRERGASITDIVILVVAADDGINVQTKEAIKHAKNANVPIIVFINKIDKPDAKPEQVINQLADNGLTWDEWGGDTIIVQGSALNGEGINKLIESIILVAEVNGYTANPSRLAIGTVIESSIETGLGNSATVIVQNGTLNKGDFVIAGSAFGKIKIMFDDLGKEIKQVIPSQPAKIFGLNKSVPAGQKFVVSKDEREMKEFASRVEQIERDSIPVFEQNDSIKKFNIILKADVYGSLEAITNIVNTIEINGVKPFIVKSSIGMITENDVIIAKSAKAIIFGFNVKPTKTVSEFANSNDVKILFYDIIYKLQDDLVKMIEGSLDPVIEEEETGEATIQQIWQHSKVGTIAGCKCNVGTINRNDSARLLRNGVVLYKTKIGSMKHFKEEVSKISAGQEFGITLEKIKDLQVGDLIQCYKLIKKNTK